MAPQVVDKVISDASSTIDKPESPEIYKDTFLKMMGQNKDITSPLENILFGISTMSNICLPLIYVLIIQLILKLHVKDSITFNFSNRLGEKLNGKLEYYVNKIIKLNKAMSIFYI